MRALRSNPHVLAAGDEVVIPDRVTRSETISTTARTTFTAAFQQLHLRVRVRDLDDVPLAKTVDVLLATGGALFALDLWVFPGHLFELSALSVLVKLVLVALMAVDSAWQLPLFWIVVLWSGVFSHAPATLRHLRYTREGWVRK